MPILDPLWLGLLDPLDVPLSLYSAEGLLLWANQACCQLLGYSISEWLRLERQQWLLAETDIPPPSQRGQTYRGQKRLQPNQGSPLSVFVQGTVYPQGENLLIMERWEQVSTTSETIARLQREREALQSELDYQVRVRNGLLLKAYHFESLSRLITEELRNSLDEHNLLQTAVEELALGLELDTCGITLLDQDQITVYEYPVTLPPVTTYPGYFLLNDPLRVQQELTQKPHYFSSWYSPEVTVVVSCHPIVDEDRCWGWLWLVRRSDHYPADVQNSLITFGDSEARLGQQIASQCAIAIRQSRLHRRMEAQLEELQRLSSLRDDFLSTVSHELRTPLSNIQLAVRMIRMSVPHWNRQVRYLDIVEQECQREMVLVSNLLELRRLDQRVTPDRISVIVLEPWLHNVLRPFEVQAAVNRQSFVVHLDPQIQTFATDEPILQRILTELVQNACSYTPVEGLIEITVKKHPKGHLGWQIRNRPVEIPPEELAHVFDPFFYRAIYPRPEKSGAGLGLALVRVAVTALGGTITVVNPGEDVIFKVDLPPIQV